MISFKAYQSLARHLERLPLYSELPADQETPVTLYARRKPGKGSFLLESVVGGSQIGRYSFIGLDPLPIVNSFEALAKPLPCEQLKDPYFTALPPFHAGAVGYISYDWARRLEKLPVPKKDPLAWPELAFFKTQKLIALDHVRQRLVLMAQTQPKLDGARAAYGAGSSQLAALEKALTKKPKLPALQLPERPVALSFDRKAFAEKVRKAQRYIHNGDIFQVVLSERFQKTLHGSPFQVYRALRMINPSPYMFYLEFPFGSLIGSSPEILVRLQDGQASLRPIAGTRPRGKSAAEERQLEQALLADEKERAEHTMLVDLGRNDLGRVCVPGTVHPTDLMVLEKYSHVMHMVSHVEGKLQAGKNYFDLLSASFPAGTVSGAPKIRAMEIIHELESCGRGPYAGSVLYLDDYGNLDSCIAIRTLFTRGKKIYFQAGAGIVADSKADLEYAEIIHKASALAKACLAS